jgi:DNA-binding NtrC family response regulator
VPPLRDRKEDIHQLVRLFVGEAGAPDAVVKPVFMLGLCAYDWPFNVRELSAAVRRAVALADGPLDEAHLPPDVVSALADANAEAGAEAPADVHATRARAPSEAELRELMERHAGNVAGVARELAKDRAQIHRWLRRYAIAPEDYRR